MFAGSEFADRLAAREAKRTTIPNRRSRILRDSGVQPGGRCHLPWTWPSRSIQVSYVAVPRKRALEECTRMSEHEIVAGRRAGSVKCTKCLQVCGKKQLRVWLPTSLPWKAKDALFIPLPLGLPAPSLPLNNFDQEDAEIQHEDDEPQNDVWQAVFDNGEEVQKE